MASLFNTHPFAVKATRTATAANAPALAQECLCP